MSHKKKSLPDRLDEFQRCWVANPAAKLDFVELIAECLDSEPGDYDRGELAAWLQEERRGLASIGFKKATRKRRKGDPA